MWHSLLLMCAGQQLSAWPGHGSVSDVGAVAAVTYLSLSTLLQTCSPHPPSRHGPFNRWEEAAVLWLTKKSEDEEEAEKLRQVGCRFAGGEVWDLAAGGRLMLMCMQEQRQVLGFTHHDLRFLGLLGRLFESPCPPSACTLTTTFRSCICPQCSLDTQNTYSKQSALQPFHSGNAPEARVPLCVCLRRWKPAWWSATGQTARTSPRPW